MTNFLTSVGIQQVSITIASGATSATAAITGVGSGAFIIFQGYTCTDTAALNDTMTRVALTNSTTVTATRNASGTSQTVTINAVVIDGDTTNLIKSVQTGTISLSSGATSGTSTITAVTNTNAAVHYLGESAASGSTGLSNNEMMVSLSGTTVTGTCRFGGDARVLQWEVIEFQGSSLNSSVQNVAHHVTSNSSVNETSTITSVTTGNAFLIYGGSSGNSSSDAATIYQYASLTNSTTITYTTKSTGSLDCTYNNCVVEFVSGLLNSSVQRGTISLSSATSNTATITSVGSGAFCNWLNNSTSQTSLNPPASKYRITKTNATTLTMNVNTTDTGVGSYEVIEFPAFASGTTVTFDAYCYFEALATQKSDVLATLETLTNWNSDRNLFFESTAIQTTDRTLPGETFATQRSDGTAQLETTGLLTADGLLRNELLTSLIKDTALPNEILAGQQETSTLPVEALASQNANASLTLEWLGVLTVTIDGLLPLEILAGQQADAPVRLESQALLRLDRPLPAENTASQRTDSTAPVEVTLNQQFDARLPAELTAQSAADRPLPAEMIAQQLRDTRTFTEFLATALINGLNPLESTARVQTDQATPLESTGALSVTFDGHLPLEISGSQQANAPLPLENVALTTTDAHTLTEFLAGVLTDRLGPLENILQIQAHRLTPFELTGLLSSDAHLPVELVATAFSVTANASFPLEIVSGQSADYRFPSESTGLLRAESALYIEWRAIPAPTPAGRIIPVTTESRIIRVSLETRTLTPNPQTRVL